MAFSQTPACSSTISYQIELLNESTAEKEPMPEFMEQSSSNPRGFTIETSDEDDVGAYQLLVTGMDSKSAVSASTEFTLEIVAASEEWVQ